MDTATPQWLAELVAWLRTQLAESSEGAGPASRERQNSLWLALPYREDAPAIHDEGELRGAVEHLEYAVFRRYENQVTRAERSRLDNTIRNALFKVERYLERLDGPERRGPMRSVERSGRQPAKGANVSKGSSGKRTAPI